MPISELCAAASLPLGLQREAAQGHKAEMTLDGLLMQDSKDGFGP